MEDELFSVIGCVFNGVPVIKNRYSLGHYSSGIPVQYSLIEQMITTETQHNYEHEQ